MNKEKAISNPTTPVGGQAKQTPARSSEPAEMLPPKCKDASPTCMIPTSNTAPFQRCLPGEAPPLDAPKTPSRDTNQVAAILYQGPGKEQFYIIANSVSGVAHASPDGRTRFCTGTELTTPVANICSFTGLQPCTHQAGVNIACNMCSRKTRDCHNQSDYPWRKAQCTISNNIHAETPSICKKSFRKHIASHIYCESIPNVQLCVYLLI